jgi:hypothetical protein
MTGLIAGLLVAQAVLQFLLAYWLLGRREAGRPA